MHTKWSFGLKIRPRMQSKGALFNATWKTEAHGSDFTLPDITIRTQTGRGLSTSWAAGYFISIIGRRYPQGWSSTTELIQLLPAFPTPMTTPPTNGTSGNQVPA